MNAVTYSKNLESEKKRIQIDVTESYADFMENLASTAGIATKKELFNNAISLLNWAIGEIEKGNSIASFSKVENSIETLRMPIFDNVRKRTEAEKKDIRIVK